VFHNLPVPDIATHSVAAHFDGDFDDAALSAWAADLREKLNAPEVTLGLVFMAPELFTKAAEVLEILRVHARVPLLVGCSSQGLIVTGREHEDANGVVLALYHLPGGELRTCHFSQPQVEAAEDAAFWHDATGVGRKDTHGWLTFADPFHLNGEEWLRQWNEAWPGLPVIGGLASSDMDQQRTQVYLNGDVFEEGGVAVSVGGGVAMHGVISQGCTPIGETWTITHAEHNIIHEIGNRPAYEVLVETFDSLSKGDQDKTRGNLLIGLVINEYLEEFKRGDFLIRNLIGADPNNGAIAVGALPRTGQTLQFQRRDATAASDDLDTLLAHAAEDHEAQTVYGGCLCCCSGRGTGLFDLADHDAGLVHHHLGDIGVAGFFCNGEIGPVGDRNFLHGYTASLALFVPAP